MTEAIAPTTKARALKPGPRRLSTVVVKPTEPRPSAECSAYPVYPGASQDTGGHRGPYFTTAKAGQASGQEPQS